MENAKATEQFNNIFEIFNLANLVQLSLALLVLVLGFGLSRLAKRAVRGLTHNHLSPQQTLIASRTASLVVWLITLSVALQKAGIDIGVALGAAGIFTVAIGFAAQTSVSNLISGLFLMAEKPFVMGEEIQVGTTSGVVISIDLLSAKLRTADNLLVRIPNESLLRSEIINLTRFPKRRVDILLDLAHQTDVGKVQQLLDQIVAGKEKIDQDPAPQLVFVGFGETGLKLRFSVWTETAHHADLKTQLLAEIKQAFQQEGIAFPNAYRTLIVGAPVEVKMVDSGAAVTGSALPPGG